MPDATEGVPVVGLREIKLLQELDHPNILKLVDVFVQPSLKHAGSIYLGYEIMTNSFDNLVPRELEGNFKIPVADVKAYLKMLLEGIDFCHTKYILHRDLKPDNLLLSENGVLKIGDFGLARMFGSPGRQFTPEVITLWYRPPELLFGSRFYSAAVDMWSVGCIFAEMWIGTPLFPIYTDSSTKQLGKIFSILGTPNSKVWPGIEDLPHYTPFEPVTEMDPLVLRSKVKRMGDDGFQLLCSMLKYNPSERISASAALLHPYFRNPPSPTDCANLAAPPKRWGQK